MASYRNSPFRNAHTSASSVLFTPNLARYNLVEMATTIIYLTRRWGYDEFTLVQQLSPAFAPIGRAR